MEKQMKNWIRVSKIDGKTPFSKSLIYKWKHRGEHSEIFAKVGGGVFVDLDAINRLMEKSRLDGEA